MSLSATVAAAIEIHPGEHPEWHVLGLTLNADTVWATLIAGAIVVILGFVVKAQMVKTTKDHVPTKLQMIWEGLVDQVQNQVSESIGRVNAWVVQLAVALFFFILIANWLEMIPSELNSNTTAIFVSPTADTNLTYAMAILVIVGVWTFGIRERGFKGYFGHFLQPYPAMLPLNILEELIKPVTLALRLFGNIFAGGIMLGLIAGLVQWKIGAAPLGGALAIVANVAWKLFDMVIGVIQAFIFALLTVLYFGMASGGHGHDEKHTEDKHPEVKPSAA